MINPWRKNRILEERVKHAEDAVLRLMRHNQSYATSSIVLHRELSLAHAALRRKNMRLKQLQLEVNRLRSIEARQEGER